MLFPHSIDDGGAGPNVAEDGGGSSDQQIPKQPTGGSPGADRAGEFRQAGGLAGGWKSERMRQRLEREGQWRLGTGLLTDAEIMKEEDRLADCAPAPQARPCRSPAVALTSCLDLLPHSFVNHCSCHRVQTT